MIASQRDEAVKAAFAREADEIFTKSGKPKKGSRLGEAEQRVSDAQENATAAEQQWLAGQQAADNLAEAEQTLTEQTRRKEEMEKALVPLRQRQAEANEPRPRWISSSKPPSRPLHVCRQSSATTLPSHRSPSRPLKSQPASRRPNKAWPTCWINTASKRRPLQTLRKP